MNKISNEKLLEILNKIPRSCLCGHFEWCEVCSKTTEQRQEEEDIKTLVLETLKNRNINLQKKKHYGYGNVFYYKYEIIPKRN